MLLPMLIPFVVIIGLIAYNNSFVFSGPEAAISRLHRVIDGDTIEATVPGEADLRLDQR